MLTFEQALELATKQGGPVLRGTADMYVGISELHRERNDLQAAEAFLERSQELGEHTGLPQNPYRWRLTQARIREAQGDLDSALDLLQEAERVYTTDFSPDVRPIGAVRARLLCRNGRVREALEWTQVRGVSVADELSYVRECEHITLARVLLARDSVSEALTFLQRLFVAAEAGARGGSVIEISLLQALGHQAQGDSRNALVFLDRALTLAEPEGYARIFIDEGTELAPLLRAAARTGLAREYAHHLLSSLEGPRTNMPAWQRLVEPLSEREVEVLRLLGTDLSGPEIARELTVSLSTLRTHTQNIFSKLGVNNRRAAVRRAEQLDVISQLR
jgi:LuxR family maltose regulon positive regulatory protein